MVLFSENLNSRQVYAASQLRNIEKIYLRGYYGTLFPSHWALVIPELVVTNSPIIFLLV